MSIESIKAEMIAKASKLSIEELKNEIIKDSKNPTLPDVVFETLLSALEQKISEEEFVEFMENL